MSGDLRALLDRPFELLLELEGRIRATRRDMAADQAQAWIGLAFRLGERWLVAPREEVREVLPVPVSTRIPNGLPWLGGIANVRGNLLTLVDLAQLLGEPAAPTSRLSRVLVLNSDRLPLGFIVDEVLGYRQFSVNEQAEVMDPPLAPYVLGGFEQQGRQWQAFSLHRLALSPTMKNAGRT